MKKKRKNVHTEQCIKELEQYFNGERDNFSVILNPSGTHFQKRVWQQLGEIPYG